MLNLQPGDSVTSNVTLDQTNDLVHGPSRSVTSADRKRAQQAERKRRQRQKEKATAEPMLFTRPEWRLFTDCSTFPQRAGCQPNEVGRLALKEVVDNALGLGVDVNLEQLNGGYRITDAGPGIAPDDVVKLFSVNRELTSSKLR